MSLQDKFNARVEAFLAKTGIDPTSFGRLSMNDPAFVFRLRRGSESHARTIDRVDAWMERQHKLGGAVQKPAPKRKGRPPKPIPKPVRRPRATKAEASA